jgi:hypothetical protein
MKALIPQLKSYFKPFTFDSKLRNSCGKSGIFLQTECATRSYVSFQDDRGFITLTKTEIMSIIPAPSMEMRFGQRLNTDEEA